MKKRRPIQFRLFHPIGVPKEETRSIDYHHVQSSAEISDHAARENHPPQQVAADVRYANKFQRY